MNPVTSSFSNFTETETDVPLNIPAATPMPVKNIKVEQNILDDSSDSDSKIPAKNDNHQQNFNDILLAERVKELEKLLFKQMKDLNQQKKILQNERSKWFLSFLINNRSAPSSSRRIRGEEQEGIWSVEIKGFYDPSTAGPTQCKEQQDHPGSTTPGL